MCLENRSFSLAGKPAVLLTSCSSSSCSSLESWWRLLSRISSRMRPLICSCRISRRLSNTVCRCSPSCRASRPMIRSTPLSRASCRPQASPSFTLLGSSRRLAKYWITASVYSLWVSPHSSASRTRSAWTEVDILISLRAVFIRFGRYRSLTAASLSLPGLSGNPLPTSLALDHFPGPGGFRQSLLTVSYFRKSSTPFPAGRQQGQAFS
ncbi:hypothetical protein ADICEAN_04171 [Cesiribacter andamanensis AMV16]|uniref:Uncharacterized protein n=1 Tax=Cesiribacter andamanensis AMV16 TaxID=1279009 RepID=M7N089_9BACT|nr:hypothetical protein ADICEAN_04171 [Cesiribacter andamanensis AMV16]